MASSDQVYEASTTPPGEPGTCDWSWLGEESAGLVADVVIRRALVRRAAGEPLSAMADAQQAVVTAFNWGRQAGDDRAIPVARVLGLAAEVQLFIGGDPQVAVAAADWSIQVYQEMFFADGQFAVPREQAFAFRCAIRSAAVVHEAFGRTHLAQPLLANALALDGEPWPEFDDAVAQVRDCQPTLAAALHAAGHDDLARRLAEFKETEREGVVARLAAEAEEANRHGSSSGITCAGGRRAAGGRPVDHPGGGRQCY